MPHPITDMFVSLQEPQAIRVANMAERVAVASIDSQKMADAHASPQYLAHMYYLQEEQRTKTYNSFTCVNSYYKGREGGIGSSFKTVRYYNDKARQVRDEMLAKMA